MSYGCELKHLILKYNTHTYKHLWQMKSILLSLCILIYSLNSIACETTLTLGLGNEWKPYYFEEQGKPTGADIQYIKNILAEANICLAYLKIADSLRSHVELEKGNIDFLAGATYNLDRDSYAQFSSPYRSESIRIFWLKNKYQHLTNATLSDLVKAGLTGVSNRGSYLGSHYLDIMKHTTSIHLVSTIKQRMKMLEHGRVDFAIEDEMAGLKYLSQHYLENIELHPFVVFQNDVSFMFSRKTVPERVIDKINLIIKENKTKYNQILLFYMAP